MDMNTATEAPTRGTRTPTDAREYVVSVAGRVIARGTHEACFAVAMDHDTSCTIATALSHADVWPECAVVPYAASQEFLRLIAERGLMRSWAGHA
jgi:hypothetical protein